MSLHGQTPRNVAGSGQLGSTPSAYSDPPATTLSSAGAPSDVSGRHVASAVPAADPMATREVIVTTRGGRRMNGKVLVAGTLVGLIALGAYLLPKLGWGTGGGKGDGGAGSGTADTSQATPTSPQGTTPAASLAQTPPDNSPLRIRVRGSEYFIGDAKVTLETALERAKSAVPPPGGGAPVEIIYAGSARAGAEETLKTKLREMNVAFAEPDTLAP